MARDYKPKRGKPSGFSGWAGLALGLAIGLAIAGAVYFKDRKSEAPAPHLAKVDKKKPHGGDASELGTSEPSGTEEPGKPYDFYDMLPKFEVVVPEKDKEVKRDILPAPETRRGTYVLQAGSYKNFADADRVRAQLALQGIESKVQKVSVDNDTWHRIRVGPISNLDELNRMRQIMRKADVDVLVIRVGD
ncbi:MAG: SPOR domain-containing protein [Steroidobacteraceae bacterium]|jgi:cell division protein FtsN